MVECGGMDLAEVNESGQTVVHIAAGYRHCQQVGTLAALLGCALLHKNAHRDEATDSILLQSEHPMRVEAWKCSPG